MRELARGGFAAVVLVFAGCSSGGGGGSGAPALAAPAAVAVRPADGAAVVTWTLNPAATGYKVYYGASSALTTASPSVSSAGPSAIVSGLPNGARRFFAVTATAAGGESALTVPRCGVPTAANTSYGGDAMDLYDGLCDDRLDQSLWSDPGAWSASVSNDAAALSVDADNMESNRLRNHHFSATASVRAAGRVTTLSSIVKVPSATASRTGGAILRATGRLRYQPPSLRLQEPTADQDLLVLEVGLEDSGTGLYAFRRAYHCDEPTCATVSDTGVAFQDPAGFSTVATARKGSPASYDAAYRVTVQLDEAHGIFHWSIHGDPEFATTVSGTADPAAYLAATSSWTGIPLAGAGYLGAQLLARVTDSSLTGGGSGKLTAVFDDVLVGQDDGSAAPWDDFSGANGNSGPTELSLGRWSVGAPRVAPSGSGALSITNQGTSHGSSLTLSTAATLSNPEQASVVQAEIAMPTFAATTTAVQEAFRLDGRFHNDGTGTTTGSAVGDVYAAVNVTGTNSGVTANYLIYKCTSVDCSGTTTLANAPMGLNLSLPIAALPVRVGYDRDSDDFVFGLGTATVTLHAPAGASYVAPARAPQRRVQTRLVLPSAAGTNGSMGVTVKNVFVANVAGQAVEACNALDPTVATAVQPVYVAADPPAATGGTIAGGTYHLTAMNVYTGAGGATGPAGSAFKMAWGFAGTTMSEAHRNPDGTGEKHTGAYGVGGTTLSLVESCPTSGSHVFSYSVVSGSAVRLYEQNWGGGSTTAEYVLTRQ